MFLFQKSSLKEFEYSLTIRYLILAAMGVPLLALLRARSTLLLPVLLAAVGFCLGHWYSYTHLQAKRRLAQGVMFIAIHLAFLWMCAGLFIGLSLPQAQFAIFTQAITSFDLRYRRSLFNTLFHSLIILYLVASLSRTLELAIYLALFAVLVLAAFYVAGKEDGLKSARLRPTNPDKAPPRFFSSSMTIFGFGFGGMVLLAIMVAFLFTPRFANRPLIPPFSLDIPLNGGVKAEIVNPGLPLVQINGWNNGESDYFYGFDNNLDLRYRGGLSEAVVMYVRSPSRSYWRSHSYDFYTGVGWQQSQKTLRTVKNEGGKIYYPLPRPLGSPLTTRLKNAPPGDEIVQTFTIVREQPNLIFAAYRPTEIFIRTDQLAIDSGDGLRTPEPLKVGLTYSVVSYRPNFDPDLLRQDSGDYPPEITARYLQLPATISDRTRELARDLTRDYDNAFDKVMALNGRLLSEYAYNFFPPPHPEGAEVVDTFLFQDKEGVCEQYVTALVVMARTLGIPARLVTGYGAGDYNQLTGYYEVRANDAHSWAEIYFPGYGWVPFDPTPGWTPQPYPTPVQTWFLSKYGGALLELDLPFAAILSSGLAGLTAAGPFLLGAGFLLVIGVVVFFWRKGFRLALPRPGARLYSRVSGERNRRLILNLYQQGVKILTRKKYRRREKWETVAEYAGRFNHLSALAQLTQAAEIAAYRPEVPDETIVAQAKTALAALKQEIKPRPRPASGRQDDLLNG